MSQSDIIAAAFFGVIALIMLAWGVAMWAGAPEADRRPAPSLREIVAETVGAFRGVPDASKCSNNGVTGAGGVP